MATMRDDGTREPVVSVIIPVFNGERHLREAIDSVFAQTYRPLEVIVVDDGSTDGSAAIARSYPEVRYIHQANAGPAAARNTGIAASTGSIVALLDHDDLWLPDKLTVEVALLTSNENVGCIMSRAELFLDDLQAWPEWVVMGVEGPETIIHLQSAILVRRDVYRQIGGLDETFRSAEDTEWLMRAADHDVAIIYMLPVLMKRRVHAGNLSYRQDLARHFVIRAVHASIQRRRAQVAQDQPQS